MFKRRRCSIEGNICSCFCTESMHIPEFLPVITNQETAFFSKRRKRGASIGVCWAVRVQCRIGWEASRRTCNFLSMTFRIPPKTSSPISPALPDSLEMHHRPCPLPTNH